MLLKFQDLVNRIFKTKLAAKIWLCMVSTTLAVIVLAQLAFNVFFNQYLINEAITNAGHETTYVAENFSDSYESLIQNFVLRTSSSDFKQTFKTMLNSTNQSYTIINNSLQNILIEYAQMGTLSDAILFARQTSEDDENIFYHAHNRRLKRDVATELLNVRNTEIDGISILGRRESPFLNQAEVITIAIPLHYIELRDLILLAENEEEVDMVLFFFLSTADILDFFELYCNDRSQGTLYLVDTSGRNVSLASNHSAYELVNESSLSMELSTAIAQDQAYFRYQNQYIFFRKVNSLGQYLVNILPPESIAREQQSVNLFFFAFALICLVTAGFMNFLLSIFVTGPLKKLMSAIHDIKHGNYRGKASGMSNDEIGQLNDEIDSMHKKIQEQIVSIKHEEAESYRSKLQLLSEQMNPHFIYNSLEFVNMEIYNQRNQEASAMITSLGNYLRFSLAHGENEVTLHQETEHVRSYLDVMNYRFKNQIQLSLLLSEDLRDVKITKGILQPLVENSLKYGFRIRSGMNLIEKPRIQIRIAGDDRSPQLLRIEICDNGSGIDIDKAKEAMLTGYTDSDGLKHFGLNNILRRLTASYDNVRIEFSSIPFYENIVSMQIDLRNKKAKSDWR